MSETQKQLSGPDLAKGVALSKVADGAMLLGHAHGEPVLLARRTDRTCQTYRGEVYNAVRQFGIMLTFDNPLRSKDICGANRQGCMPVAKEVWQRIQDAAAEARTTTRVVFRTYGGAILSVKSSSYGRGLVSWVWVRTLLREAASRTHNRRSATRDAPRRNANSMKGGNYVVPRNRFSESGPRSEGSVLEVVGERDGRHASL